MKYMGSKSRIKKSIVPILQNIINKNNITTFIDCFVGGANIIDDIKCKNRIANDISKPLIALWKGVQEGKEIKLYSREEYKEINKNKEQYDDFTLGVIGFLHSYNARYFGGYAGEIVTKTGVKRDYRVESINNILKQKHKIMDVKFFNKDYKEMKEVKNTLIYCDIPYENTTDYNSEFNHHDFWEWARNMSKNNIVVISELQAPNDFICIWEQEVTRTQNNRDRFKSVEKLFIYKDSISKIGGLK